VTICVEPILAPQNADRTPAAIPVFEEQVAISADGCEVLSAGPPRTPAHAGVAARPGAAVRGSAVPSRPMNDLAPTDHRDRRDYGGLVLVAAAVTLMWVVEVADVIAGGRLDRYGIEPRDADGLVGILTAPFLHLGFGHLLANTVPFVALGAVIALSGAARLLAVSAIVALVAGAGTWLVAPAGTEHIGASGVVFGYATYLIARGAFTRSLLHLVVGVVVLGIYGSTLLFGVVPADGISWQGHLFGGIGGVLAARVVHRPGRAARARPAVA
jgi:membrane associated rhomboid family serine protease